MRKTHRLVPLKQHHPAALVARREIVARVVKLDRRDDVGCAISIRHRAHQSMRWRQQQAVSARTKGGRGEPRTFRYLVDLALVAKALGKAPLVGRLGLHLGPVADGGFAGALGWVANDSSVSRRPVFVR